MNDSISAAASRRIALVAGIFFLLTFTHVAILPLYDPILNDADYIITGGSETSIRLGVMVDIFLIVANVATAVVLFRVVRRHSEALAVGYVAVRIFESATIAVGAICLLAVLTLREDLVVTAGADAASLSATAASLVAVRDWTFFFGPGLCSGLGNGLLLGYLMFRSGLVPRNMALIGLIGGPVSLIGLTFVLFGAWEQDAPPQFLFTIGEIVWELSLGVYLIVKGFKISPDAGTDSAGSSDDGLSATPPVAPVAV